MDKKLKKQGFVYLVGGGIGSLSYLTQRAEWAIRQAEVLIYDALINADLLTLIPQNCLPINVGKRGGLSSVSQSEINHLLVVHCRAGKRVVRLKSGDPGVFGRVYPEMQALKAAGCAFELVPGLSSAIAAPLLAHIPLTDKKWGSVFAVLSGQEPDKLDWLALARIDTLVILMGGKTLPQIVTALLEQGRSPQTPVAIIKNSGQPQEQLWLGDLTDIVEKTMMISLSPAVILIGNVVNLRTMSHPRPLSSKTILVTRAAEQSSQFTMLLGEQGARVLEMPTLEIQAPSDWQPLDQAIGNLSQFHWLILTSANGVNFFFQRLKYWGKDSRDLQGIKIAVVGKKTAQVLENYGLNADFIPPNFVADDLVKNFPENLNQKTVLFPRVESGGREILVQELGNQGATVVEVPAYQSVCPDRISPDIEEALQQQQVNIITFASSKTVRYFTQLIKASLSSEQTFSELLAPVVIASIGPQTSKTCLELLGRVDIEATEYTLEGLTTAIAAYYF